MTVKARIVGIWAVTIVLLLLRRFEVIDWSPWVIVAPGLFMLTIIVIALSRPILIGLYRGWKIRIVDGKGKPGNVR